ncbi:MAG: citrate synthase [Planctomycetaceae bacterium]|nr:citrate synthase [Planctomycetaceae bacterium]
MSETNTEKATLTIGDKTIELPVHIGTEGDKSIDISKLFDEHGLTVFDPSLGSTSICKSTITYIDGEKGILRYRGIPIEQFDRPKPNFIEVAHLLIFGTLPNRSELSEFSTRLTDNELLHEGLRRQFNELPPKSPPMAILSAMLSQLACYHEKFLPLGDDELFIEAATRLISKARTIAAYSYRRSKGLPFMFPDPAMRYCGNFLHMMFSIPFQQYIVSEEIEDAMNLVFILHADHEQNCSTATVRTVGSAKANLFASCAAAVSALWGPLHGGANVEVVKMLETIQSDGMTPELCIEAAKDKSNPFKLFGFGHRVYKNYDPRARILRNAADRVFSQLKTRDPLLDTARKLEELALQDSYFVDRKLYPNVDFYSGILLRAMGIPTNMFTVIFAIGRLPGWIAQWKEQHDNMAQKIIRPRQVYCGNKIMDYVPIEER